MKIVGLGDESNQAGLRQRVAAFRAILKGRGHELEIRSIPRGSWARVQLWRSLRDADVVILQRRLLSSWHLWWLRRHARRLVYDIDEAVWERDFYSSRKNQRQILLGRLKNAVQAADRVVAGNDFLRDACATFTSLSKIEVLPTCIDVNRYPLAAHRPDGESVHLAWMGKSRGLLELERRRPLWDTIAERVPAVRFKIISDRVPQFKKMPIVPVRWSADTAARELAAADIGVSWLPNDGRSQGKSGLKAAQCMAAGLPVVANPVGAQTDMVQYGETGFLAETPSQWVDAVRRLAADAELRRTMGRAGRELVERDYSLERGGTDWLRVLDALRSSPQRVAA